MHLEAGKLEMKLKSSCDIFMPHLRLPAMAFAALCSLLSGCGIFAVSDEANRYRVEQSTSVRNSLERCRSRDESYAGYNHQRDNDAKPDCYLAMVDSSARPMPGRLQTSEKHAELIEAAAKVVPGPKPLSPLALSQVASAGELIDQVAWMAMLANLSYHRFAETASRSNSESACFEGLDTFDPLNTLTGSDASVGTGGGWQRWEQKGIGCRAVGGLFYETFVYRAKPEADSVDPKGDIAMAVIAFRGTENYWGQIQRDWPTNFANAFGILPSDYAEVQRTLPELLRKLLAHRQFPVFTTGHSLGGALAQLAAYLREDVTAAYTFNTSPATGWAILRSQLRDVPKSPDVMQVDDPNIIRVTQEGEWLNIARVFSNAANSTVRRSNRTDVHFDFPVTRDVIGVTGKPGWGRKVVELHSISMMACNLAARVVEGDGVAAFGYTKEMAQRAIKEQSRPSRQGGLNGDPAAFAQQGICQVAGVRDQEQDDWNCKIDWLGREAVDCKKPNNKP